MNPLIDISLRTKQTGKFKTVIRGDDNFSNIGARIAQVLFRINPEPPFDIKIEVYNEVLEKTSDG